MFWFCSDRIAQAGTTSAFNFRAIFAIDVAVFAGTKFETSGTYTIEVVVDDVMKLRYPIPVVVVEPQQKASSQGASPEEDPEAPKENI